MKQPTPTAFRQVTLLLLIVLGTTARTVAQVPKPADVFSFEPGADYKLAKYSMLMDYYQKLDKASNRVQMVTINSSTGQTTTAVDGIE